MKVNPQAQSLFLNNNKDLKGKNGVEDHQAKEDSKASKVQELKQQITDGQYKVDVDKTASAMLSEFVR